MQYREYGNTGIGVSALGFGTARFPVARADFDMDLAVRILRRAFDLGINYVDTASVYSFGRMETAIGKAIKGRREDVFVSTKVSRACETGEQ